MPRASTLSDGERSDSRPSIRRSANRPLPLTSTRGAVSRCSLPLQEGRRRRPAAQAEAARRPCRSRGRRCAGRRRRAARCRVQRVQLPSPPRSSRDRPRGAEHRADDAVRRRRDPRVEVETVAVGLGVEPQARAGRRRRARRRRARAARGRTGSRPRRARLPTRSRPVTAAPIRSWRDVEPAEMDVEVGQERLRLARRDQLGQPVEDDEVGFELVDDEAVEQEVERPPVDVDLGRFGEQARRDRRAGRRAAGSGPRSSRRSGRCGCAGPIAASSPRSGRR